jgi:hypothetical protein
MLSRSDRSNALKSARIPPPADDQQPKRRRFQGSPFGHTQRLAARGAFVELATFLRDIVASDHSLETALRAGLASTLRERYFVPLMRPAPFHGIRWAEFEQVDQASAEIREAALDPERLPRVVDQIASRLGAFFWINATTSERFEILRKRGGLTQRQAAETLALHTRRPCAERTVRSWVADGVMSARKCPVWAVEVLEAALKLPPLGVKA